MTTIKNKVKRDDSIVIRCTKEEKNRLREICQNEGLNLSMFFRLCMREAEIGGIKLRLEIPNTLTAQTIKDKERGKTYSNVDDLMRDLNEENSK